LTTGDALWVPIVNLFVNPLFKPTIPSAIANFTALTNDLVQRAHGTDSSKLKGRWSDFRRLFGVFDKNYSASGVNDSAEQVEQIASTSVDDPAGGRRSGAHVPMEVLRVMEEMGDVADVSKDQVEDIIVNGVTYRHPRQFMHDNESKPYRHVLPYAFHLKNLYPDDWGKGIVKRVSEDDDLEDGLGPDGSLDASMPQRKRSRKRGSATDPVDLTSPNKLSKAIECAGIRIASAMEVSREQVQASIRRDTSAAAFYQVQMLTSALQSAATHLPDDQRGSAVSRLFKLVENIASASVMPASRQSLPPGGQEPGSSSSDTPIPPAQARNQGRALDTAAAQTPAGSFSGAMPDSCSYPACPFIEGDEDLKGCRCCGRQRFHQTCFQTHTDRTKVRGWPGWASICFPCAQRGGYLAEAGPPGNNSDS